MVIFFPPAPCTARRVCAWNLVNMRHRPGSVGVYRIAAERYRFPLASLYSLRDEHGAVKSRSALTSLFPALYPPC